jgi:outer membrane protein assembly factor BamB
MRSQVFDLEGNRVRVPGARDVMKQAGQSAHLFCPTGFLDDSWWHRSYWVFGRSFRSGATGYFLSGRFAPSGKLLVYDDEKVYGFTRKPQYFRWTTPLERQLFASSREPQVIRDPPSPKKAAKKPVDKSQLKPGVLLAQETQDARIALDWKQNVPLIVRAMVLADRTLFVAGPPDVADEVTSLAAYAEADTQRQLARQAAALDGAEGSLLWAVSARDGSRLAELKLAGLPVFDGLVAANSKLYLTTMDGKVVCFGARPEAAHVR